MRNITIALLFFAISLIIGGCAKENNVRTTEETMVGNWKMNDISVSNVRQSMDQTLHWEFNKDRTFYLAFIDENAVIVDQIQGTWDVKKQKGERLLKLESTAYKYSMVIKEIGENKLVLYNATDDETTEFLRD